MKENKVLSFVKLYKWHLVIWIIGLIFLGNYIYKKATAAPTILNGIFLSAEQGEEAASSLANEFTKAAGYDDTTYVTTFDTSLSYIPGNEENASNNIDAVEAIISQSEEELLDFVAGPQSSMIEIAYTPLFSELTTLFNEEQLAAIQPYLRYVDQTVMEELDEANENDEDTSKIAIPDVAKPDEMKEPLALLIDVSSWPKIAPIYEDAEEPILMGLLSTDSTQEIILEFVDYIMQE